MTLTKSTLGILLKKARKTAGLTQVELAELLQVSKITIIRREKGVVGTDLDEFNSILERIGIDCQFSVVFTKKVEVE